MVSIPCATRLKVAPNMADPISINEKKLKETVPLMGLSISLQYHRSLCQSFTFSRQVLGYAIKLDCWKHYIIINFYCCCCCFFFNFLSLLSFLLSVNVKIFCTIVRRLLRHRRCYNHGIFKSAEVACKKINA